MRRNRVRRDEDETKGVMLKFLHDVMEMHPGLWDFTQQVPRSLTTRGFKSGKKKTYIYIFPKLINHYQITRKLQPVAY